MKLYFFLSFVFAINLIGCSFSKSTEGPQTEVVKKVIDLSPLQAEIIKTIERNDVAALKILLSKAKSSDYDFHSSSVTPMSVALQNDSLEIVKVILDSSVDSYNLGAYKNVFHTNIFNYSLKRALNALLEPATEITYTINKSEKYLLSKIKKTVRTIIDLKTSGSRAGAKAAAHQAKLGCDVIETYAILEGVPSLDLIDLLKDLSCSPSADAKVIEELYHLELRRGFQNLYVNTKSLEFLLAHPNLPSQLWQLDENLWISPELLYRISRSAENYSVNENFCKILAGEMDECKYRNTASEWQLQKPEYQLVYFPSLSNPSETNLSFRYYPYTPVQNEFDGSNILEKEDRLFSTVSLKLNGCSDLGFGPLHFRMREGLESFFEAGTIPSGGPGEALRKQTKCSRHNSNSIAADPLEDFEL